ncbi:hydroxyethylthiazole kinase [Gephyromycinifex aptenodytis]|uniref:hydroxyethylthiazole kinase n=1 Tax=Gephyromycinifex aptenodytis TaxID=2716227 RepID=UPI001445BC1F|nr:hydroxyethylthiazole kinase [Gephyromycinifex aptenodytis]
MTDVAATQPTADDLARALQDLRDAGPLVQCLTNIVVTNWSANVLLAVGAAPAMVDTPHEARLFAGVAGGVLINLGTPQEHTVAAMFEAVAGAAQAGTPWVLDPVAAGGLPWRTEKARELIASAPPAIVRGNASEILGLAGGAGGRGVDSLAGPQEAADVASELAAQHSCTVAVSGAVDHLTDGARLVRVRNGHEWMTRVTGVGCSLGALMAAFAAVCDDPLVAATAATATLTVAADEAASCSRGPGSFAVALLDSLSTLTPADLAARVAL